MCRVCDNYRCKNAYCVNCDNYMRTCKYPYVECEECRTRTCFICNIPAGNLSETSLCYCISINTTYGKCAKCSVVYCNNCYYYDISHNNLCIHH